MSFLIPTLDLDFPPIYRYSTFKNLDENSVISTLIGVV